jgi:hypothetical protein
VKKIFLFITLVFAFGFYLKSQAETFPENAIKKDLKTAEKIFINHADDCLDLFEQAAQKESITGVAIIAFIPGDATESWISKMKVVGRLADNEANLLAIAYAKASEMAVTLKNSGNSARKSINGELGYMGGVIAKIDGGYLVGAFSGGSGQQDVDVSELGLEWLAEKFKK